MICLVEEVLEGEDDEAELIGECNGRRYLVEEITEVDWVDESYLDWFGRDYLL